MSQGSRQTRQPLPGGGLAAGRAAAARSRRAPARQVLVESEQQFRILVDSLDDYAIYMLDAEGRVMTWNAGARRIKGYTAEEILGRNFSCFYTADEQASGLPRLVLEAAARDGRFEREAWRVRKDGSRFWASAVIHPIRDEEGALVGFAKVTRDITERLRQQEVLERARATAAQAQKMEAVGQLTGGIAHDFNNLLTAILGSLDLLERCRELGAEPRRLLAMARRAAERGGALTQRLLAFSRRQALAPRAVDVNRLVVGMSEILARTLGESIRIETVLAGGLWTTFVDLNQLENALLNLAINARDAMPDGGKLTVETGNAHLDDDYARMHDEVKAGQYVQIAVSDTGEGMTADTIQHAFEPFYTTKGEGKGTGLGLSQVYGFVKQTGGHVKIYSEVGQGSTVKIYLPRHPTQRPGEGKALPIDVATLGAGEIVLLVEDDEDVREYARMALNSLGYRVLEAADSDAALRIIDQQPDIAVLFTDVGLPGINGRALAEEARRRQPRLSLLYTTGYARNAIVHNGLLDADVDLLPKPFTVEALGRKLRELLQR